MEEWKTYKIKDISKVNLSQYSLKEGWEEIAYLDTGSITENRIDSIQTFILPCDDFPSRARRKVRHNDILFSTVRPNQRHYGILKNPPENLLVSTGFAVITVDPALADADFVYFYLTQTELIDFLQGVAEQSVSAYPSLKSSDIEDLEIVLPSLAEQKRIASILSSLDNKIALNVRINHNLEEQAQALYKSWFVDFVPFMDERFVDSELGKIPEGWHVGTLSELGDIVAGGTPSKAKPEYYTNNGIAWLTPKDLSVKCIKYTSRGETDITEEGYKNSSAKLMPRGSILFSSRAPIGYITIAKGDICTNQGFKSVVPRYAGTGYLYYWLREHTDAIESQASGSTFKEASGSLMKSFPAIIPDKNVLDSFEKELAPILNEQEILEEQIYHAEQIRDSLLPRMMSGELVITC